MFFVHAMSYWKGYVTIRAEGRFTERFINLCVNRGIYLWDIKRSGENAVTANISKQGFLSLRPICRETHTRVHIITKKGAPFLGAKLRRRKFFVSGFLIFAAAIFWMCSRIWAIEISGTYYIDDYIILRELERCGVAVGASVRSIDQNKVKNEMLAANRQLAFVWVDIRGTKAYVEVKQKEEKPEIVPRGVACNIVAKTGGVIRKITVLEGEAAVTENQYVREGDLLVSGIRETKFIGMRTVRAEAEVLAQTEHRMTEEFSVRKTENKKTGKTQTRYAVMLFGKECRLYRKVPQFAHFEATVTEKQGKILRHLYLPIGIKKTVYDETEPQETVWNKEEAVEAAKKEMQKKMEEQLRGITIEETEFEVREKDEEIFEVEIRAKCLEEIAKRVEIPA